MSKIKEIHERLVKNPEEYASIRFSVARQIFSINVALYFLAYLFTVGGFYFWPVTLDHLAVFRYHLYTLLIISVVFFGYSLVEYLTDHKIAKIMTLVFFSIFWGIALAGHLGAF